MEKVRRYEFEGVILEIPLRYDAQSQIYLEEYPDFIENPVYTPAGCPIYFTGEDACSFAEAAEGEECPDCGSCRFFRPADPHTWFGVCGHEKKRRVCAAEEKESGGSGQSRQEERRR